MASRKPTLCLVTPALAEARNGNWQTAQRWARMLGGDYAISVTRTWTPTDPPADLMLALHARRSAASIDAWARTFPTRPLLVALTGTDLYQDIASDPDAQRSLAQAWRLIVLQDLGCRALPANLRDKCVVCYQSAPARRALPKTQRHLRALMVGHLRDVKSPQTYFAAVRALRGHADLLFDQIGEALEPALGEAAAALALECPNYRWLGALSHSATRARIDRAHVLVHPSRLEGGAHAVLEAVVSGTPVLASRVDGNVGMLGDGYDGYFAWNDVPGLVALLTRSLAEPGFLIHLQEQCAGRAALFDPQRERGTLLRLVAECRTGQCDRKLHQSG
jgi:putative glycosyltransferase (TIGR04348 family)